MYRPPENSNRVKSIKSKFENIENKTNNNEKPPLKKNGLRSDLIERGKTEIAVDLNRQNLSRQLSDPAKRNIKRTPAFRFDSKNTDKTLFQRTNPYNKSYYFDKIEQFNSALKNCDTNRNIINRTEIFSNEKTDVPKLVKPALIKSKSSHDFAYIRSKFDRKINEEQTRNNENQRKNDIKSTNLASLYTEPVPKSQRNKVPVIINDDNKPSGGDKSDIHSANTLRICDNHPVRGDNSPARRDSSPAKADNSPAKADNSPVKADNSPAKADNGPARTDSEPVRKDNVLNGQIGLTDTLKAALKKPLPKGPAPVKPPRTFEHTPGKQVSQKNSSFLHNLNQLQKEEEGKSLEESKPSQKHDPRYMLNKLENALRNNRINRSRKQSKHETSTTSGEDSDDSVLFKSKTSKRELPSIPDPSPDSQISFNFNCLNGLALCKSNYETIKEPNSSFFVSCKKEEPVYAEPFNYLEAKDEKKGQKSLYYMSTPLLGDEGRSCGHSMDDNVRCDDGDAVDNRHDSVKQKQMSAENSSLSSFTSDLESAASTPLEEHNGFENAQKIKHLINTFETKSQIKNKDSPPPVVTITDSAHRIEDLKMTLQKTLERCFDVDNKEDLEQHKERKVSVDTIISKFQTYVKTMPKYQKPKVSKDDRLFYCCLIVGWDTEMPQIKFKFPAHVKIPDKIEDLCYPEAASGPLAKTDNAQCYSLVITNDKGERTFGYCRRVIPEGSTECIPLAYCILSKHRAPRFYKKILMELESRHGIPDKLRDELISEFYFNKFPRPGESIKINLTNVTVNDAKRNSIEDSTELDLRSFVHVNTSGYGTLNKLHKNTTDYETIIFNSEEDKLCSSSPSVIVEKNGRTELILTLHQDSRYEEADLKPLHKLPPDILLKIFASLLLERKVILISCVISKLSCSVDALQSILYPFSWPHTFIPILPQCLWDVVESPTPVICGILSVNVVNNHKIEHGIVVDLDERNILYEEGDENSILSDSMKKAWHQGLSLANTVPSDHYAHSVYLSDAYIKVFIASLKHYKNHIMEGSFDKEGFIKNGKTKGIKRFLKWFTETTMFMSFIDTVLSNPESFALFDKKIEMYGSDESNVILTKLLEWKK